MEISRLNHGLRRNAIVSECVADCIMSIAREKLSVASDHSWCIAWFALDTSRITWFRM